MTYPTARTLAALGLALVSLGCGKGPPGVALTLEWLESELPIYVWIGIETPVGTVTSGVNYSGEQLFLPAPEGSNEILIIADEGTPDMRLRFSAGDFLGNPVAPVVRTVTLRPHRLVELTVSLGNAPGVDSGTDAVPGTDGGGPSCTWGSFSTPVGVATVNEPGVEHSPFISADGLELYFASDRPGGAGGLDIWVATRSLTSTPFTPPESAGAGVNTFNTEWSPSLTVDGLCMYLETTNIVFTCRTDTTIPFLDPVAPVMPLDMTIQNGSPEISASGSSLYYQALGPGLAGFDIWSAVRSGGPGEFLPPGQVLEDMGGHETGPSVTGDELTLFFAFQATGSSLSDIYMATRPNTATVFTNPVLVTELNSSAQDTSPSISADGRTIYFHSTRNACCNGDIFVATRECL